MDKVIEESPKSSDRVVLIVGGARGIGFACASECASMGYKIALVDSGAPVSGKGFDATVVDTAANMLIQQGAAAKGIARDVKDGETLDYVFDEIHQTYGRLDAVVFSLGFQFESSVLNTDAVDFDHIYQTHLRAPFLYLQRAAKTFLEQKSGGSFIWMVSPSALFGAQRQSAMSAMGAGAFGVIRSAALELRKHGIRVHALAPTAKTRLTESLPMFKNIRADSLPPESVAKAVAFLMSDSASHLSGELLGVAGSRFYGFSATETTGYFTTHSNFDAEELLTNWLKIVKP